MKRLFDTLRRLLTTLISWSLTVALARALYRLPTQLPQSRALILTLLAFGGGVIFFAVGTRFITLYVVGHELTHWLAAKCFRRRTGRFRLGLGSGSIAVERPNIWITLAPYFIPVYALIWIGLYGLAVCFWRPHPPWLDAAAAIGVGITYAFHVVLTAVALRHGQSDLSHHGPVASLSMIVACNLAILFVVGTATAGNWRAGAVEFRDGFRWQAEAFQRGVRRLRSGFSKGDVTARRSGRPTSCQGLRTA